ncbi:MAG: hypothetical protein J6J23_02300, partial [Clostridia bacterium]|nr:hypothetical protein [Clostridia bacterium]
TLNDLEVDIYVEYFDGTYSAAPVTTIDFNDLCGVASFDVSNISSILYLNFNYFEYTAEIEVVGEGFESFKYDSTVEVVIIKTAD